MTHIVQCQTTIEKHQSDHGASSFWLDESSQMQKAKVAIFVVWGFGPLWICRNWRFYSCITSSYNGCRFMSSNMKRNQSLNGKICNSHHIKSLILQIKHLYVILILMILLLISPTLMIYFIWRLFSISVWEIGEKKKVYWCDPGISRA